MATSFSEFQFQADLTKWNLDTAICWTTQFWENLEPHEELHVQVFHFDPFEAYTIKPKKWTSDDDEDDGWKMAKMDGDGRESRKPRKSVRDPEVYIIPRVKRRWASQIECVFCKNNDEDPDIFRSHILKDPEGRIVCPILRRYDCPLCRNGGGDYAHTIRYCPMNRPGIRVKHQGKASKTRVHPGKKG